MFGCADCVVGILIGKRRRLLPILVGRKPDSAKPTSRPRFRACLTSKLGRGEACEGGLGAVETLQCPFESFAPGWSRVRQKYSKTQAFGDHERLRPIRRRPYQAVALCSRFLTIGFLVQLAQVELSRGIHEHGWIKIETVRNNLSDSLQM